MGVQHIISSSQRDLQEIKEKILKNDEVKPKDIIKIIDILINRIIPYLD